MNRFKRPRLLVPVLWIAFVASAAGWAVTDVTWGSLVEGTWRIGWASGRVWVEGGWDLEKQTEDDTFRRRSGQSYWGWRTGGFEKSTYPWNAFRREGELFPIVRLGERWCLLLPVWWITSPCFVALAFLYLTKRDALLIVATCVICRWCVHGTRFVISGRFDSLFSPLTAAMSLFVLAYAVVRAFRSQSSTSRRLALFCASVAFVCCVWAGTNENINKQNYMLKLEAFGRRPGP